MRSKLFFVQEVTVSLTIADQIRMQEIRQEHPELKTNEAVLLWALRHVEVASTAGKSPSPFDAPGISPAPAPSTLRDPKKGVFRGISPFDVGGLNPDKAPCDAEVPKADILGESGKRRLLISPELRAILRGMKK